MPLNDSQEALLFEILTLDLEIYPHYSSDSMCSEKSTGHITGDYAHRTPIQLLRHIMLLNFIQ